MLRAALAELDMTDEQRRKYRTTHARRQAIMHGLEFREVLYDRLARGIRENYGFEEEGSDGPFTFREYLHYMVKPKVWCESVMLVLLASMWSLRLTVIRGDSCHEVTFRHEEALPKADMILIFNCSLTVGHYSAVLCEGGDSALEVTKIKRSRNYDRVVDLKELAMEGLGVGAEDHYAVITKERLEELERKEKQLDGIMRLLEVGEDGMGSPPPAPPMVVQVEKDVQRPEVGKQKCDKCNIEFVSPSKLTSHLNREHLNQYKYHCREPNCGRAFSTKEGMASHVLTHRKKGKLTCDQCDATFTSQKSKKRHLQIQHGPEVLHACPFAPNCPKSFKDKANMQQHRDLCPHNPNPNNYKCQVCGQEGFKINKLLRKHRREKHGHA